MISDNFIDVSTIKKNEESGTSFYTGNNLNMSNIFSIDLIGGY